MLGNPKLAKALVEFGNHGLLREQQRWTEYWKSFELQLPLQTRGKIMKTTMLLQRKVDRGKLQEKRAREYHHLLLRITVLSNGTMGNPSLIVSIIMTDFGSSGRRLQIVMTAYNYY